MSDTIRLGELFPEFFDKLSKRIKYTPWLKSASEQEIRNWLLGLGRGMEWLVKEVRQEIK